MRRILVTGGAGFIGSHLVERLLAEGIEPTVLDNFATGVRENVPEGATLVEGDVRDRAVVDRLFASERFDAVFHVAGQASISRSFATPEADLETNVLGTLNVVRACIEAGVPRLLNASSMTAYGEPAEVPTREDAACVPVSNYGVTKYAAERYAQIAGERPDVDLAVTSLRMFNVYGERQSVDNPYQGVLAIFIGNVLRGEPLTIHGDGEQTRDFVYVTDVVDAWLLALESPDTVGRVLNVGSGRETSVNQVADAVLAALGESRESWDMRSASTQLGDQRRSAADTRALAALGWSPARAVRGRRRPHGRVGPIQRLETQQSLPQGQNLKSSTTWRLKGSEMSLPFASRARNGPDPRAFVIVPRKIPYRSTAGTTSRLQLPASCSTTTACFLLAGVRPQYEIVPFFFENATNGNRNARAAGFALLSGVYRPDWKNSCGNGWSRSRNQVT